MNREPIDPVALDAAVDDGAERAFGFLERLVAIPSTVGNERTAQDLMAEELGRIGFDVSTIEIPASIGDDPSAGVPQMGYEGRHNVLGRLEGGDGPSLLLNGHIDVVPAEDPDLWSADPFHPVRIDGWLHGRGAGDMKGGSAMATLAIEAFRLTDPAGITGSLSFLSVIEEECTGNGTLAALAQDVVADAVVLPEPTDLDVLVAGVGILWLDIDIVGHAAHASTADRTVNAIEIAACLIGALRDLEREMNADVDEAAMADVPHPYNVNIGTFHAGDWSSSVPARTRLGVRVGHPTAWSADEAERHVQEAIDRAVQDDPWLRDHPPRIHKSGFRAQGYAIDPDHALVEQIRAAHRDAHGTSPSTVAMGSTTDARYYLNGSDTPALCYGPRARNIHGVDEAVELQSIVDGAKTLTRFLSSWFAGPPEGTT
jgi:acetylornithine deacetylase